MKSRRWFLTDELVRWKYMQACGDYVGPFFSWPNDQIGGVAVSVSHHQNFLAVDSRYATVKPAMENWRSDWSSVAKAAMTGVVSPCIVVGRLQWTEVDE